MSAVVVTPYDPEWPRHFERIHAVVWPAVQQAAMRLEHVGSTAVPGLAAKPIVDACIVVASPRDVPFVSRALVALGYEARGELGVPDRHAFRPPPILPKHHLYVSSRHSASLRNHLGLRDYLRAHPDAAQAYGELKIALAAQYSHDIDRYIAGKTDFICGILAQVGLTPEEIAAIRQINSLEQLGAPRAS